MAGHKGDLLSRRIASHTGRKMFESLLNYPSLISALFQSSVKAPLHRQHTVPCIVLVDCSLPNVHYTSLVNRIGRETELLLNACIESKFARSTL